METSQLPEITEVPLPKKTSKGWIWIIVILFVLVFYFIFGFVAVQPIGAIPDGVTVMVVRMGTNVKFFDSADAMCLRFSDGVSLLCRMGALSAISDMNIVARLPYIKLIYVTSTGGLEFDR